MDAVLIVLSLFGIVFSVIFAVVVFYLARLALAFFRDRATDEQLKKFRILRCSDKTLGALCFCAALSLVI